ncbi:L-2-amino-thiazoline-4-carboxylic acid hydrolase [Nocardia terpenica]|uniref:L-2-amino-thiazoline-4-carboxylic acid hydrolase n=1 Tax=Nocardia terpenica TaxID=455432 RepID=A0A164LLN9_9NOCA|nr:L-2-amino-thiazoline-4-carboxylic acid hydrolase [Nocardia terpenica]KZM72542.1 hypothetical protein AWN90_27430 [Nocardia terpenica]NQE92585.1 L-2-amino-thiazoline-4-carboxylic acid hydrolase [Nocardia terpenica]
MTTDPFRLASGGYTPDPERDTALIVDGVFASVAATLRARGDETDPTEFLRANLGALEADNADMVVDEPSRHNLRMTLALVVAYRYLCPRLGRADALAAVRAGFVEPTAPALRAGTRRLLDAAEDPFTALVGLSKIRERDAFGPTFTFERAADDDRRYHLNVTRCFYHDVLVRNSAPELTPGMCEFDRGWIDAIVPERHGFRFTRTTTIGLGGDHCPFHFDRLDLRRTPHDRGGA